MELQFKKIEIDNIGELLPFYAMRHNRTCDSVFLESFIWKEYYHVRYAIWENKALLWLMESKGKSFSAMPMCREEDLPDAFHAIEQYFNEELGYPLVINLADEYAVEYLKLPEERYLVEEQVDSRDYLYDGNAMRTLAGKKLHKKKNRVNAFRREYEGRYEYRRLCCSDSQDIWEFLDTWREQKGEDVEEHLDYEVRGIHDILKNCSELYIRMGGVYIDGRMEAFSIGSYNPVENMAVIHIEKANPEINGLYQYINQQFLIEEFPEVDWVNREDDMGLEGLRQAKLSYNPADFARKYLVEQLLDGKKGYRWAEEIENTAAGSRMEYVTGADKDETIRLWNACFPEDSDGFVRYYFTEKTRDNRILVKKENGLILSMVHYNPYRVRVKGQTWDLDYLVGVATEPARQREGHFRDMFCHMLADMRTAGRPITYLVPVNPKVYEPLGFSFFGDVPTWRVKDGMLGDDAGGRSVQLEKPDPDGVPGLTRIPCQDTPEDCERAAAYMEKWLSARYEMYTCRDSAYVSRLVKELASEQGTLYFLMDGEALVGLQAVWGIETREQRFLYGEDAYVEKTGVKPWNMARVTNVEALLERFMLKSREHEAADVKAGTVKADSGDAGERRVRILLEMEDSLIAENQGCFLWAMDAAGSSAVRMSGETDPDEGDPASVVKIKANSQMLIGWLFGYRKPEEIWPELDDEALRTLALVDTVDGVFLDEIV